MKQLVSILLVMALATACGSILPTPTLTPTATPLPPTNTLTAVPTATRVPPTNTPQPTATNTPTPTPVVLNGTVRNNANVRDLPSDKAKILGTLQRNAQLTLVGRNNDSTWFQIPFPLAGSPERGWVLANLISTTINLSSTLPVIVPITPTVTASPTKGTVVATATISGTPPTVTPRPTTTSTPTSVAQKPGGTVFYSGFDGLRYSINSVKADGSVDSPYFAGASEPALAPNGQQLAWHARSSAAPCANLAVSALNGSSCSSLSNDSSGGYPTFSADGKSVAYHSIPRVGNNQIFRVSSQCCSDPALIAYGKRPAWQPVSGEFIAYDGCKPDGSGCFSIYLMRAFGGDINNPTLVTHGTNASWSPDGKHIAFQDRDDTGFVNIFVVGIDGKNRTQVTKNKGNNGTPIFAADGQWIFFLSDQAGAGWAIEAVRTDGSGMAKVKDVSVNADEWDLGKFAYSR